MSTPQAKFPDLININVPPEIAELLADLGVINVVVKDRDKEKTVRVNFHNGLDTKISEDAKKALEILKLQGISKQDVANQGVMIVFRIAAVAKPEMKESL